MPKLKIGEKVAVGEKQAIEKKVFTNGHKSFTASEANAMLETQNREKRAAGYFEQNKMAITKPRNPITGDVTPRVKVNSMGDVVEKTGSFLFPQQTPTPCRDYDKSPNPLTRTDRTNERINSLQSMQDNIGGELEYIKMKMQLHNQKSKSTTISFP